MARGDLVRVRLLCEQLGYRVDEDGLAERLERLTSTRGLYVAVVDAEVVGWVDVHERELLETARFAELGGIVVDATARRNGIGRALVDRAIAWARARGLAVLRLRSNVLRDAAHQFYPALGFTLAKTSHTYELGLTKGSRA